MPQCHDIVDLIDHEQELSILSLERIDCIDTSPHHGQPLPHGQRGNVLLSQDPNRELFGT